MRRRIAPVLGAVLVAVTPAGCGGAARQPAARAHPGPPPVAVPLAVHWFIGGAHPLVTVRVGNGPAVPVLLDTGSTGLHIYLPGVRLGPHSGIAVTKRRDSVTYGDGRVQSGTIAYAKLTIGSMKTVRPVPFGLITSASCVAELPNCPGAVGIHGFVSIGEFGILGIGLRHGADGTVNPLLALAAPYSRGWSIELTQSGGVLTLRPRLPERRIARFSLPRDRTSRRGAPAWKDTEAKVCWATPDLRGAACEPTLFDSGSTAMVWWGGLLSHSDTSITSVLVNPGEDIAAWQPGTPSPFWTFTSGEEFSHDAVIAVPGGHPLVIAAVQAFLQFVIAYDATHGRITLYPQSAS